MATLFLGVGLAIYSLFSGHSLWSLTCIAGIMYIYVGFDTALSSLGPEMYLTSQKMKKKSSKYLLLPVLPLAIMFLAIFGIKMEPFSSIHFLWPQCIIVFLMLTWNFSYYNLQKKYESIKETTKNKSFTKMDYDSVEIV
jgi:hypothetical protein